jgi:hypothetical protein
MFPAIVAGPETTIYVTAPLEAEVALTASGAAPYALQATISQLTRSSLHRCLERHGISRLPEMEGDKPRSKKFDSYPIGFFHIDPAEVRTAEGKLYLFVAIDRTSKFAVVELVEKADVRAATAFLEALIEAVPHRIHTVLTDNGIQFADLPKNRQGPTARFRGHPFDRTCHVHGIEHPSPSRTIPGPMVKSNE